MEYVPLPDSRVSALTERCVTPASKSAFVHATAGLRDYCSASCPFDGLELAA